MSLRPKTELTITTPIYSTAAQPQPTIYRNSSKGSDTVSQVYVNSLRLSITNNLHLILLKEITGDRYLPIWVDPHKSIDIIKQLEDTPTAHPVPSEVMTNLLILGELTLDYVIVDALENDLFQAKLITLHQSTIFEIKAHPSDAISLALQLGTPIFVDSIVMDEAGVLLKKTNDDRLKVEDDEQIEHSQDILSPKTSEKARLRQLVAAAFNLDELRALCFDMGIDYEDIPGESKMRKIIELISYFGRQNSIVQLIQYLSLARPNVIWV